MITGHFNKKERFILCINVLFDWQPLTTLLSSVSRNPSVNYETLWTHNYIIKFEFRTDIYTLNFLIHAYTVWMGCDERSWTQIHLTRFIGVRTLFAQEFYKS